MADQDPRPPARGDEAELFRAYNHELARSVAGSVSTSTPQVIEDACAFAWAQFMERQPDRDRNWRGWLFRVAQRESWRLERERGDAIPTRDVFEKGTWTPVDPHDRYALQDGVEDAFSVLERLPLRLQRIAMLRALGLRHTEISEITGDSPLRVGQLISRANFEIHEVLTERARTVEHVSPRAERLWELERDQSSWLTERIGSAPRSNRNRSAGQTAARRAWRRAALALDDYRTAIGPRRFREAGDVAPVEPELRRQHEAARRAIAALAHARGRSIGRGLGD